MGGGISGSSALADEVTLTKTGATISAKNGGIPLTKLASNSEAFIHNQTPMIFMNMTVVQGTWVIQDPSLLYLCDYLFGNDTTHANADEITFQLWLDAGTYSLINIHETGTNYGISKVYIDSDLVQTCDNYSGGFTTNVITTTAGITVVASGLKTIHLKVDGKNGLSSNYYLQLTNLWFKRTA